MKRLFVAFSIFVLIISCVKAVPSPPPVVEGCPQPPHDVFIKTGVDIKFAQSTYAKAVVGAIDVKTTPEVVTLLSQAASEARMRDYLRCLAIKRDGFTREQAAYLDIFNAFVATKPNPDQFTQWQQKNPFPGDSSAEKTKIIENPVVVSPTSLRLYSGGWSVKTQVTVSNQTDLPLYNVGVKMTISNNAVDSNSIKIDTGANNSVLRGKLETIEMAADYIVLFTDSKGHEAIALIYNMIEPHSNKSFVVSGTTPVESGAQIGIWSFKDKPSEILEKPGMAAFPFKPPEDIKLKALRLRMEKK